MKSYIVGDEAMRWNGKRLTKNPPKIKPRRVRKRNIDVAERDFAPQADGKTDGVLTVTAEKMALWQQRRKLAHTQQADRLAKAKPKL